MKKQKGFTLAEVLITLGIIGVVAAITLPNMIAKINDNVMKNKEAVLKAKMIKGLNLTKAANDLNNTYISTYDFLENGLSKHLKIAKICDDMHIQDCVPYNKIKYMFSEKKEDSIPTEKLTTIKQLGLKEEKGYKDLASFVMGDGSIVVVSYNLNCIVDSGELDRDINACLAGMYDLNGTRQPNKLGVDIMPFNGASIDNGVLAIVGGVRILSRPTGYSGIKTSEYCDTSDSDSKKWEVKSEYKKYGIDTCCTSAGCQNNGDRWAAAKIVCADMGGKLPSHQQVVNMSNALYKGMDASGSWYNSGYDENGNKTILGSGEDSLPPILSGLNPFEVWEDSLNKNGTALFWRFNRTEIWENGGYRYGGVPLTMCVLP